MMGTQKNNPLTRKQPTPPQWEVPSPPPVRDRLNLPPHWRMFIKVTLIGVLTLLLMIQIGRAHV